MALKPMGGSPEVQKLREPVVPQNGPNLLENLHSEMKSLLEFGFLVYDETKSLHSVVILYVYFLNLKKIP